MQNAIHLTSPQPSQKILLQADRSYPQSHHPLAFPNKFKLNSLLIQFFSCWKASNNRCIWGWGGTVYASMQPSNFSRCLKYLGKCACKYMCLYGCYMYKFVWVGGCACYRIIYSIRVRVLGEQVYPTRSLAAIIDYIVHHSVIS